MDGKEKNAENVKGDLIESNAYSEEEIEVLSSSKIKIKGEEFVLLEMMVMNSQEKNQLKSQSKNQL